MTRRSWNGPVPCVLRLAGLTAALMLPTVAAFGQDAASTSPAASTAAKAEADSADDQGTQPRRRRPPGRRATG